MRKRGKKYTAARAQVAADRSYSIEEAIPLVQKVKFAKFDETVELTLRLGVDPKHADQMVRGTVVLPHGLGKTKRVLAIAGGEKQKEAQEAGADVVGGEEMVEKIMGGWIDFDAVVATPDMMRAVGRLGKVLGPRGLMPNPKTGTVSVDIAKAVKEIKAGKVEFRVDKTGIIHAPVGKTSFASDSLVANAHALVDSIVKAKPAAAKGKYLKSVTAVVDDGSGRPDRHDAHRRGGETLMAVTRADKEAELQALEAAFKGSRQRDPRRLQGAERPAGHRAAAPAAHREGELQGRQEHAGEARAEGHARSRRSSSISRARRRSPTPTTDPVALAKTLTTFVKTAPTLTIKAAVVQGRAIKPAEVTELAALPGKPELLREAAVRAAGADGPDRQRAERRAARSDERAGAGGEEEAGRRAIVMRNSELGIRNSRPHSVIPEFLILNFRRGPMAEVTQQQVVDYIKGISVLELSQLVKTLEAELGVSAAAAMPMAMPMGGGGGAAAPVEEKTEFTVVADRDRRQQDQRDQGRPRSHQPRPEGSEGPRRERAEADQGRRDRRTRPRRSRRSSKKSARRSRSSKRRGARAAPHPGRRARGLQARVAADFPAPAALKSAAAS